jgi:DNA-binding transcriptional MerR regulator/predicted transcriptional regulator YdeE
MFSIGEFARLGAVSIRTLRHYDEIGLLSPARVDPDTGYRYYSAGQLGQLNRIFALKELGLSLTQVRKLLAGITVEELQGMLMLRRAQLEAELGERMNQLLGVEARLRYIAKEGAMPADDITTKTIPATGVVAVASSSPDWDNKHIVAAVNRSRDQLDQLGIVGRVKATGPLLLFYDQDEDTGITVHVGVPVAEPPAELPAPAAYQVLPEIEAVVAVRNGPAASIFPMVVQEMNQWATAHGYQPSGTNRNVWVHEVDDIADVDQQVFEIQLPFTRPA